MASDLLQGITPSYLGPSVSTDPFKGALNDDFFSKWSPALLQTWSKYFSLCWPIVVVSDGYLSMRDCMCSLVIGSLYDIPSSFLQHHISNADIALLFAYDSHPLCCSWEYQRLYDTYLCYAKVMFLSFQIFESVEVDVLVLVLAGQSSPDINRASTILDNHWLTTPLDQLLLHIMIVVFSTLR